MKVVIIKYNAGNIHSVYLALKRLGIEAVVTDGVDEIKTADKIIFPGVGEASSAMNYLKHAGLDKLIPGLNQPFLGICLGLQLLCNHSEENDTECLKVFNESVKRFPPEDKVPHMGWNSLEFTDDPLFNGVTQPIHVYFVHSYYAETGRETIAKTDYILPFSAALRKDNFFAVQFHPEKSSRVGEQILKNFIEL